MNRYLLFCDDVAKDIVSLSYSNMYIIKEKIVNGFKLKNINFILDKRKDDKINRDVEKRFLNMIKIINDLLDSDDASDGDYVLALDNLSELESYIMKLHLMSENSMAYIKYLRVLNHYESKLGKKYHSKKRGGKK